MQIDVEAFFFLLMAVVVFLYYAMRKGKNKRPTIAEEVSWEELTIEDALQQYNPAAAVAPLPAPPAAAAPLPVVVETAPEPPPPPAEPGYFTYEDAGVLPRRRKPQKRKRIAKKLPPDLSKPFLFNPRDAILYETIWKRKY